MKKYLLFISIILFLFLIVLIPNVEAVELSKEYVACHDANVLKAFRVFGYVVLVLKILVPIILIITGMYSFFKATLNDDANATRNAVSLLITKIFVGAGIFFAPTIISAVVNLVSGYDSTGGKYSECIKCVTSVSTCNSSINRYK